MYVPIGSQQSTTIVQKFHLLRRRLLFQGKEIGTAKTIDASFQANRSIYEKKV